MGLNTDQIPPSLCPIGFEHIAQGCEYKMDKKNDYSEKKEEI